jgi:hypothetical protein
VDQSELKRCCAILGVEENVTLETLDRAQLKKNLALIRNGTSQDRERLCAACEALRAHLETQPPVARVSFIQPATALAAASPGSASRPVAVYQSAAPAKELHDPFSFDSHLVNIVALPLVALIAWLVNLSPLVFFLRGFHVWVHEFGHAIVAWLVGKRALPLPIGWTNVSGEKSPFVYFGILFLLGVLLVAGWKERKIWPVLIALAVAPLQFT